MSHSSHWWDHSDAVGRRGVRKHSRISDEKEVSHGYEEVEEEEDVEVTLPARACIGLRAGFMFREAQRSDFKTRPLLFFVTPNRLAVTSMEPFSPLRRCDFRDGPHPQPPHPSARPIEPRFPGRGSSIFGCAAHLSDRRAEIVPLDPGLSTNPHRARLQAAPGLGGAGSGCR
jgi:hypothetical protein